MNYSNPILICDENEEFRILIRDMLTKNGFFHVLEATHSQEALTFIYDKQECFVLIEASMLTQGMIESLANKKNFIVFVHTNNPTTLTLSARLGVEHFMSYPFHSKKLLEKITALGH